MSQPPVSMMPTELQKVANFTFGNLTGQCTNLALEVLSTIYDLSGGADNEENRALFAQHASRICELQTEANATESALIQVAETYAAGSVEDRKAMSMATSISDACKAAYENHELVGQPQKTPGWTLWCEQVGGAAPQDSDDDLQIGEGAQFKNYRCVLTQKRIFDLDDPVEDSLKYIWDRAAITAHIRAAQQKLQPAKNPAAPQQYITLAELKPSRRVKRAAAREKAKEAEETQPYDIL